MLTLPEIIGIVGPIRAGKTTAANYLVERYGYSLASNSEILKRILNGMGIVPSRANMATLGNSIFEVLGNDTIARYRIDQLPRGRIVVDGIRYAEELTRYSLVPTFKLIGVTADSATRFERTLGSSETAKDLSISEQEFNRLAISRSELNLPQLLSASNLIISNLSTRENLFENIDIAMGEWSKLI